MRTIYLAVAVALSIVALSAAADLECKFRKNRRLPKHWANPTDCGRFYQCTKRNEKIEVVCSIDNEYNPKVGKCAKRGRGYCKLSFAAPIVGEDNVCDGLASGVFLPMENFCRDYYICDDNQAYPQNCPSGSYFNPENYNCEPDSNNICWQNKCIGETNGALLPNDDACDSYYQCEDNEALPLTCPEGNIFDEDNLDCVPGSCTESTLCTGETTEATTEACTGETTEATTEACTGETTEPTTACTGETMEPTTDATTEETLQTTEETPIACIDYDIQPDPNSCKGFLLCLDGTFEPKSCGAGEYFDIETNQCQNDVNGVCPFRGTRHLKVQDGKKQRSWNTQIVSIGSPRLDTCFDTYYEGQFVEHPKDCQKFLICTGGALISHDCGRGQYYDPSSLGCQPDEDQTCAISKLTAVRQSLPQTIAIEAAAENVTDTTESPDCGKMCEGGYSEGDVIANATACAGYSICTNGTLIQKECAACYLFDACTATCVLDANYTCWANTTDCSVSNITDCDSSVCATAYIGQTFPTISGIDPSAFCYCEDGIAYLDKCENGSIYDAAAGVCQPDTACDAQVCLEQPEYTVYPSLNDTQSFCLCVAQAPVLINCPNNGTFNAATSRCQSSEEQTSNCSSTACLNQANYTIVPSLVGDAGFCVCINNVGQYLECNPGQVFNATAGVCMSPVTLSQRSCDISACAQATNGRTYSIPALGNPEAFCYCLSTRDMLHLNCNRNKIYSDKLGVCISDTLPTALRLSAATLSGMTDAKAANCPGGFTHGQFIPFSGDCQQFYICAYGKLHRSECGQGNYFDRQKGICAWDRYGVCSSNREATCEGVYREGELAPFPGNRRFFYVCFNGRLQIQDCGEGTYYDPQRKMCLSVFGGLGSDRRLLQRSARAPAEDLPCADEEKRAVAANCAQYEICWKGKWQKRNCQNQRYYDAKQERCLEPRDDTVCENVRVSGLPPCGNDTEKQTLPSKDGNCKQYFRCNREKWQLLSCEKGQYYASGIGACLKTTDKSICLRQNDSGIEYTAGESETNTKVKDKKQDKGNKKTANGISDAPAKGEAECQHTSMRYYETDCTMYLMCLEGRWWYQYCPVGMYFNTTFNYCLPLSAGGEQCKQTLSAVSAAVKDDKFAKQACSVEGKLRASATDCDKYYVCSAGKWSVQRCKATQYYNATMEACRQFEEFKGESASAQQQRRRLICEQLRPVCDEEESRVFPLNCTAYEKCVAGQWRRESCPSSWTYDDVLQQCVPNDGSCSSNGLREVCRTAETRPHPLPQHCMQFFYCDHDTWLMGECLRGHTYAPVAKKCLPHAAGDKCKPIFAAREEDTNNEGTLASNPCLGVADGTAVAHATDCDRFFLCLHGGILSEQHCTAGSLFDATSGYCRPDQEGVCQPSLAAAEQTTIDDTTDACASAPHGTRLPHAKYCNLYYACVQGLAIQAECGAEKEFSVALGVCQPTSGRTDCARLQLESVVVTAPSCLTQADGSYVADLNDCTRFYICAKGQALPQQCANGAYYDAQQHLCLPDDGACPYVVRTEPAITVTPPPEGVCAGQHGVLLPSGANCNNFYVCISGKLRHEVCYAQHYFNATSNQCEEYAPQASEPRLLPCPAERSTLMERCSLLPAGAFMAEEGDCRRYVSCQWGEPVSQRCRNGENYDSLLGVCRQSDGTCMLENGQRLGECSGRHGQLTRNPDNCRGYFVCINEQQIERYCAQDEYFNAQQRTCLPDTKKECPNAGSHSPLSCKGLSESMLYPNTLNKCRSYFECVKGEPIVQACLGNLYFDVKTKRCIKEIAECVMPVPNQRVLLDEKSIGKMLCENVELDKKYANLEDECRSYYSCATDGTINYASCPSKTLFSDEVGSCIEEERVICRAALV